MTTANQAASAYKASQQLNQHPRDILSAVHEELYRAIVSAKAAHEQNALDQMCGHLARGVRILTVLATTLNFSAVGRDGNRLRKFYMDLLNLLNRGGRGNSVSETYQSALDMLRPLCRELRKSSAD
jgi:flagellin-specific chaperone FliS